MAAQVAASGIPPYQGVAIADQQDGANAIGIIALAYIDRADAEAAASSVPAAVASGLTLRDQPFADLLPYEVTSDVFEGPNSDRYVARIIFSEPTAADNGDFVGGPFAMLMRVVDRGDIAGLLATTN